MTQEELKEKFLVKEYYDLGQQAKQNVGLLGGVIAYESRVAILEKPEPPKQAVITMGWYVDERFYKKAPNPMAIREAIDLAILGAIRQVLDQQR